MENIKEECTEEKNVIIGGDFNIRIEELRRKDLEERIRCSKDKVIENGSRGFVELIKEYDWHSEWNQEAIGRGNIRI